MFIILNEKNFFMKKNYVILSLLVFTFSIFSHPLFSQIVQLDTGFSIPSITNTSTNRVSCVVQQPDGKLLVAGSFNNVNGNSVKGLIRLNTNGTVDPTFNFNPITSYYEVGTKIKIILLEQGRILISGIYINIDTATRVRGTDLLCLNNDGSIYSGFHLGMPSSTDGIAVQADGKIIAVGNFRFFYENGSNVNVSPGIIRLNPNGTRDLTFQAGSGFPNLISGGYGIDNVTVVENGKYLVGGKFIGYDGNSVSNIVKINANGSYDSTFITGSGFDIQTKKSLLLPDGKYLIAGVFSSYNQQSAQGIVRLLPNGTLDTSFSSAIPFNIIADIVRKSDGKILVGYDVIGGASGLPNGIIQLNENGTYDNSLNFGSGTYSYGRTVQTVCLQSDNNVVLGGDFFGYNNTSAQPIFRLKICPIGTKSLVYGCNNYNWNGTTYNGSGTYTQNIISSNGCSRVDTVQLFINSAIPPSPTITQTLVSNVCGSRVYRYTASLVTNGAGYTWIIPNSVGGVSGAVVDSGNLTNSRVIKVRYTSNEAALSVDSIRVRAFSGCGLSGIRSAKLINAKLSAPLAPTSITITALQTNVCGARKYRYSAPSLPLASTSATAATGYLWDLTGTLSLSGYVIDSGSFNAQKLVITFSSNLATATGDSIRVLYTSACGNSFRKSAKLTNTKLNPPTAPASILINALGANNCGQPRYRYNAPNLPNATTTSGVATGYVWSFSGQWTIGSNAVVDSGSLTSQKVVIKYLNGNAKTFGDTIRCRYTSACGLSSFKSLALNNTAVGINPPTKPSVINISIKDTTICSGRKYRYSAPVLPIANSVYAAATGYNWILPITDISAILDSGTLNSKVIVVSYTNNRAAIAGDSIFLSYNSACGISLAKGQKLTNLSKSGCTGKLRPDEPYFFSPQIKKAVELFVYPNPSYSEFTLFVKSNQNAKVRMSISDMTGRIIETQQIQTNQPIKFGNKLLNGLYFISVGVNNKIETLRLIKQ